MNPVGVIGGYCSDSVKIFILLSIINYFLVTEFILNQTRIKESILTKNSECDILKEEYKRKLRSKRSIQRRTSIKENFLQTKRN